MPLLKYRLDTGMIDAVIHGSSLDLTYAQMLPDDPTYGYVLSEAQYDSRVWQEQFVVVETVVTAKTVLTITATPNPFPADGTTPCAVTVTPFQACTLDVNGDSCALAEDDPTLLLTSDVLALFAVRLVPNATAWAAPVRIEAE